MTVERIEGKVAWLGTASFNHWYHGSYNYDFVLYLDMDEAQEIENIANYIIETYDKRHIFRNVVVELKTIVFNEICKIEYEKEY